MFIIGDFARIGRVSVRMLRHYDAIGLLRPAHIEPSNGYRFYHASQFSQLNRVLALKGLGFSLEQVKNFIDEGVEIKQLYGMLRLRQAELETEIATKQLQLAQVQVRVSIIEKENSMLTNEVIIKNIPATRVVQLTEVASSFAPEDIGPVIGPLFGKLGQVLHQAKVEPVGPGVALYEALDDGVMVTAAIPVPNDVHTKEAIAGAEVADLPAIDAATTIFHGSLDTADEMLQGLARWIEAHGYRPCGLPREVSLECEGPQEEWVTEIQVQVTQ